MLDFSNFSWGRIEAPRAPMGGVWGGSFPHPQGRGLKFFSF